MLQLPVKADLSVTLSLVCLDNAGLSFTVLVSYIGF